MARMWQSFRIAFCTCLCALPAAGPVQAWDWYAGDIAGYGTEPTTQAIPERIQLAIDTGLDWLVLAGDERVGQYIGLSEVLQEYELNAPRLVPILSAGWRGREPSPDRAIVLGVDPRAPIPAGGASDLLSWASSHNGTVVFRTFPSDAVAGLAQVSAAFVGLRQGQWDPACVVGGRWDDLLRAGHRLYLVGSGHSDAGASGKGTHKTYVRAERGEPEAIIGGLRQGAVFVSEGDVFRLDLEVNGTGLGGTASVMGEAYVRIRATGRQPIARVSLVCDGEAVWTAKPGTTMWEERFFLPVQSRIYLRAIVESGDGSLGMSNPVFFAPESDIGQGEVPMGEAERVHPDPIYLEIDGALEILADRQTRVLGELLRDIQLRYETARVLEVRKDLVPDPVLWQMLRDDDPQVRLGVACALVLRSSVELPELLAGLLADPSPEVAIYAARMLYQYTDGIGAEDPIPMLQAAAPQVRAYLIRSLPSTQTSTALAGYLAGQARSPHVAVFSAASDGLLAMGTRNFRVVRALLAAARQGNDRALELVGRIGDRRTIPELERIFRSRASGPLKRASFLGLKRMGAPYIGRREATCAWLSSPPAIDGRIDSTEWAAAVPLTGFRGDWQSDTLSVPIQAAVGRDDSGMFIYLKCRLPAGDAPEPVVRLQDDPALDRDRRLECTFSLPGEAASPVVFAITSLGVKEDRMGPDAGWDPSWSAATRLVPGEWSAECSIPFSALGIDRPEALRLLRFNVALVDGSKPVDRWSWSVTYGGPADPSRFGDLLLAQAPSPQDRPE